MSQIDNLKKGKNYIEMLVLSILSEDDYYGYQLSQLINVYSQNYLSIPEGSLYPALYRLVENGQISAEKRQVGKRLCRVYYHIEPSGREHLQTLVEDYNQLNTGLQNILNRSVKTKDPDGFSGKELEDILTPKRRGRRSKASAEAAAEQSR